MSIKIAVNYSPSFHPVKRKVKKIKFLVFHYTGMKSEDKSIKRLTEIQSQVSCHYLIKKNGEIINLVPDLYIAWHAGTSSWKNYKLLNKNSIGIEVTNPGHQFGYKKFPKKQINSLVKISNILIKKYKINKRNILGHSDIAPERKKDPGEKFPWNFLYQNKIGIWHNLKSVKLKFLRNKTLLKKEINLFFKNLKILGYSNKAFILKNEAKYKKKLIIAFQRRFRPELVNGNLDKECLLIVSKLAKIYR
tara:strand:+ start:511 stop:1254 length:744 start_codon:yes stop_codon:yes gene_type:complete